MSLFVTYKATCDFCGVTFLEPETVEIMVFTPYSGQQQPIPQPDLRGRAIGNYMACFGCMQDAKEAAKARRKE